jgi:exodeoxyribonuclease VII small subunit
MDIPIEKALNRLIEIVESLEEDAKNLENCLALYKEGLELSKHCTETLSRYEEEVLVLQKESETKFTTVPFGTS